MFKLTEDQINLLKKSLEYYEKNQPRWHEEQIESSTKYNGILDKKNFKNGGELLLNEWYEVCNLLTVGLGNQSLGIRGKTSFFERNNLKKANEIIRYVLYSNDILETRIDTFLDLKPTGVQTVSQFLCKFEPKTYMFFANFMHSIFETLLSENQFKEAQEQSLFEFNLKNIRNTKTLSYFMYFIILREIKNTFKLEDYLVVQNILWDFYNSSFENDEAQSIELNQNEIEVNYWIEKTHIKGRPDRERGPYALGKALWSPQIARSGRKIYEAMTKLKPGDVVFHLTDNMAITGVSRVAKPYTDTFIIPKEVEWGEEKQSTPGYLVELKDYIQLKTPIHRVFIFNQRKVEAERIGEVYNNLFYTSALKLRQGAYITKVPRVLADLLNGIYKEKTGEDLPYYSTTAQSRNTTINNRVKSPIYPLESFSNETGFSSEQIAEWVSIINRKKQIIFQGPPGTGKTYIAERLARHLVSETEGEWNIIQFHSAYTYEDFIQGYKPELVEKTLSFDLKSGNFKSFCDRARKTQSPYVLVIDEINRGNLSKIFGELMYLLEYRDKEIPLAAGGTFSIPENVYIIGTMNTADRSIALVDHALRRRFSFLRLTPQYDILKKYLDKFNFPSINLIDVLNEINSAIKDQNYYIGISFFMKDGQKLKDLLPIIWTSEIEPYLEEYFYDDPKKANYFRWENLKESKLSSWAQQ